MTAKQRIIRALVRSPLTRPLKHLVRKSRETYYNSVVLNRIPEKIAPLNAILDAGAPRRINLIIPEINYRNFFGGYIAKFNLARKLVDLGYRVRVLVVDECDMDPAKWRECVRAYQGIETIFDRIEVENCYTRRAQIGFSPEDAVIATTWWTAYIARDLISRIGKKEFVYLIQEYEPFTFPMGSYFALAHESYAIPHKAVFSSRLLKEYFALNKIGAFAHADGAARSGYFENAILSYSDAELRLESKRPCKLLFYARPEAHASRNMFEVGYAALALAIENGAFGAQPWEFYGIGTGHGDIDLPGGNKLRMLGKKTLEEYKRTLLEFDLGLSLMYTPHPSLLPLEMAAAGMIVVTNECLNKKRGDMTDISENIIAGQPDMSGIAESLQEAVHKVPDYALRRRGAAVNWALDWEQAFHPDLMDQICRWLDA